MNKYNIFILRVLKRLFSKINKDSKKILIEQELDFNIVSELIYNKLMSKEPCMIARFGDAELGLIVNYMGVISKKHSMLNYIINEEPEWWWNKGLLSKFEMEFIQYDENNFFRFSQLMLEDAPSVDILAEWFTEYKNLYYIKDYISHAKRVPLISIEPYWSQNPWTRALKGKKVLVINMFSDLIEKQYRENRKKLFKDPNILPDFELRTIKAINIYEREPNRFNSWFEELEWMKSEMDKEDYDIALIGCGAYGFPLAAHAKRMGKKAVHLGGALQLLFGIKGKRWEDPNYGSFRIGRNNAYPDLMNEFWIRPEITNYDVIKAVEGGCYW